MTGVQTCALPIYRTPPPACGEGGIPESVSLGREGTDTLAAKVPAPLSTPPLPVPTSQPMVEAQCSLLSALQVYGKLSEGEFQLIRQTLLNFFQDLHIRVSAWNPHP